MFKEKNNFILKGRKYESYKKVFIIAEIGTNHDRKIKKAFKLIDIAKKAGCDAVKFQLFTADKIIQKKYIGWKILKKLEIDYDFIKKTRIYARKKKILFGVSPFDNQTVSFLSKLDIDFFKIASTEIEDHELLKKVIKVKKPVIISTGAANMQELVLLLLFVEKSKKFSTITLCFNLSTKNFTIKS